MLELTLNVTAAKFSPGEPVTVKVALRNAGSEAVKVNSRLALNTPYAPAYMREITFRLMDPDGAPLEFQAKVNVGTPADDEFKTLQPGVSIEETYDLASYYDLDKPGRYAVQAIYQNSSEPASPNGVSVWKGEVKSPEGVFALQA